MVARDNFRNIVLDPRNDDDPHVGSNVNADPKPQTTPGPDVSGTSSSEVARQQQNGGDNNDDGDGVPNQSDNKAAWVDYAVTQGATREDAEAATKDDLINDYS